MHKCTKTLDQDVPYTIARRDSHARLKKTQATRIHRLQDGTRYTLSFPGLHGEPTSQSPKDKLNSSLH